MTNADFLGSFKYEGQLVREGIIDARSGARALTGIDSSLKFFISQERPDLVGVQIPIPVKIEQGSWEALIPTDIIGWIKGVGGIAVSTYLINAAKKIAENDFKDKGIKDVAKGALHCVQWLIRIGKHLGHLALRNLSKLKWDKEGFVGLLNEKLEVLYVPIDIFKKLLACPKSILADLASVVEIERSLKISIFETDSVLTVELSRRERHIFYDEADDLEVLFPHLVHGQQVELTGVITRGNEMSNTMGFLHEGHILTCIPRKGSIVRFKSHLFLACKLVGEISRADKKGQIAENRPRLIIDDLKILHEEPELPLQLPEDIDEEKG